MSKHTIAIDVSGPDHSGRTAIVTTIAAALTAAGFDHCTINCADGDFPIIPHNIDQIAKIARECNIVINERDDPRSGLNDCGEVPLTREVCYFGNKLTIPYDTEWVATDGDGETYAFQYMPVQCDDRHLVGLSEAYGFWHLDDKSDGIEELVGATENDEPCPKWRATLIHFPREK